MAEEPKSAKVFICYSKVDFKEAEELFDQLMYAGADPWMDTKKLVLGDDWEHEIKKAVAESDAFLVCLRPGFNDIGFRQREIRWAREAWELRPPGRSFIIPFIVQPCQFSDLPDWCKPIHAGSDLATRTSFDELLKALEKHQGWQSQAGSRRGVFAKPAAVGLTERFPIKSLSEVLVFKVDWNEPPYNTLTLHVDQPLFENYPGDWFYRGRLTSDCPEFYRLLLSCQGIKSVSRESPYALLMGKAELTQRDTALGCIKEALKTATGIQQVSYADALEKHTTRRRKAGSQTSSRGVTAKYTDGDWITAAIVAPKRTEIKLKQLAFEFGKLNPSTRPAKIDHITRMVESTIAELLGKHEKGGHTDETRLEACVAKLVADILQSELAEFQWAADERFEDDPVLVFRDTIKTIASRHR